MQVNPYLFYNGNCEEALNYYQKALGAQIGSSDDLANNDWPTNDPAKQIRHS